MWPGITTEDLMCGALTLRSSMSASAKPFTANLAAEYAVWGRSGPMEAQKPFTDEVLTMWASSAATSASRNANTPYRTP